MAASESNTSRLTVKISFQEAELNRHLMQTNDSTFPFVFISAHDVFNHLDQHSHIFPPGTKARLRRLHHPFGTPRVLQAGATFCLLHHSDYLNGYSHDRLMPLWVSYTIQPVVRSASCISCGVIGWQDSVRGSVLFRTDSLSNSSTCLTRGVVGL